MRRAAGISRNAADTAAAAGNAAGIGAAADCHLAGVGAGGRGASDHTADIASAVHSRGVLAVFDEDVPIVRLCKTRNRADQICAGERSVDGQVTDRRTAYQRTKHALVSVAAINCQCDSESVTVERAAELVRIRFGYLDILCQFIASARRHFGEVFRRVDFGRRSICGNRHGREHAQHHDKHQQKAYQSFLHSFPPVFTKRLRAFSQNRQNARAASSLHGRSQTRKKPVPGIGKHETS